MASITSDFEDLSLLDVDQSSLNLSNNLCHLDIPIRASTPENIIGTIDDAAFHFLDISSPEYSTLSVCHEESQSSENDSNERCLPPDSEIKESQSALPLITPEIEPDNIELHSWSGFKVVGDNIDKNIRPRYQRIDAGIRSLHYFNSYAVLDRIDLSHFSDVIESVPIFSLDFFLPSNNDVEAVLSNMTVLASRLLVQHMPAFSAFTDAAMPHIKHQFWKELATKSTVVSELEVQHALTLLMVRITNHEI